MDSTEQTQINEPQITNFVPKSGSKANGYPFQNRVAFAELVGKNVIFYRFFEKRGNTLSYVAEISIEEEKPEHKVTTIWSGVVMSQMEEAKEMLPFRALVCKRTSKEEREYYILDAPENKDENRESKDENKIF